MHTHYTGMTITSSLDLDFLKGLSTKEVVAALSRYQTATPLAAWDQQLVRQVTALAYEKWEADFTEGRAVLGREIQATPPVVCYK